MPLNTVERIFALVDAKYKEQRDFADAIGVSASMVSQWRMGITKSYQKRLPQIAEALGTTTEYLLTGREPAAAPLLPNAPGGPETGPEAQKKAVSESDTAQNHPAAAQRDGSLADAFSHLFMSLSPENQVAVIAEMLKRQREQESDTDQFSKDW